MSPAILLERSSPPIKPMIVLTRKGCAKLKPVYNSLGMTADSKLVLKARDVASARQCLPDLSAAAESERGLGGFRAVTCLSSIAGPGPKPDVENRDGGRGAPGRRRRYSRYSPGER